MLNSETTNSPLWPETELVQDFNPVLIICKFEEDLIKTEGTVVSITFFSGAQGQVSPKSMDGCGWNLNLSKILWFTCNFEDDTINKISQLTSEIFKFKSVKFSSHKGK